MEKQIEMGRVSPPTEEVKPAVKLPPPPVPQEKPKRIELVAVYDFE